MWTKNVIFMQNTDFNWESFIFNDCNNEEFFDERILYREIRRHKLLQKCTTLQKRFQIRIKYEATLSDSHYYMIFSKYFGVKDNELDTWITKLKRDNGIECDNLSSSVADLLLGEINHYLNENNIDFKIVTKEVSEYAVKKPGSNIT